MADSTIENSNNIASNKTTSDHSFMDEISSDFSKAISSLKQACQHPSDAWQNLLHHEDKIANLESGKNDLPDSALEKSARSLLAKADQDHDGVLTRTELASYSEKRDSNDQGRKLAKFLLDNFDTVRNLDVEHTFLHAGVTKSSIGALELLGSNKMTPLDYYERSAGYSLGRVTGTIAGAAGAVVGFAGPTIACVFADGPFATVAAVNSPITGALGFAFGYAGGQLLGRIHGYGLGTFQYHCGNQFPLDKTLNELKKSGLMD